MANQLAQQQNTNNGTAQPQQQQNRGVAKFEENTLEMVLNRIDQFITTGSLKLPADYSPQNAIRSAWLLLQDTKDRNDKPVLEVCTRESIANAMLKMVTSGLSPLKNQGYFIAYGNKLSWDESYIGTIAIAKRDADVKDVNANVVYQDDEFEYEIDVNTGRQKVLVHKQSLKNIDMNKIVGAYAVVIFNNGSTKTEIMTMAQIRQAWMQGPMKGDSPAHKKFPDQMAMKSVINRALKLEIGSSDDSALFVDDDPAAAAVRQEIRQNANKIPLSMPAKEGPRNGMQHPDAPTEDADVIQDPPGEQETPDSSEQQQDPNRGNASSFQPTIGPGF